MSKSNYMNIDTEYLLFLLKDKEEKLIPELTVKLKEQTEAIIKIKAELKRREERK